MFSPPPRPKFQIKWPWAQNDSDMGEHFVEAECLAYVTDVLNLGDDDSILFSHLTATNTDGQIEEWYNSDSELSIRVGFTGRQLAPTPNQQLGWLRRAIHSIRICLASMATEIEMTMIENTDNNTDNVKQSHQKATKQSPKQGKVPENYCPDCLDLGGNGAEENLSKKLWSSVRQRMDSQIVVKASRIGGSKEEVSSNKKYDRLEVWIRLEQAENVVSRMQAKLKRAKWRMRSTSSKNVCSYLFTKRIHQLFTKEFIRISKNLINNP